MVLLVCADAGIDDRFHCLYYRRRKLSGGKPPGSARASRKLRQTTLDSCQDARHGKRLWLSSSACRRTNDFKSSGRSLDRGIETPSTNTGITRVPRLSAVAISGRTKSSGLSTRRLPSLSEDVSQR